VQFKGYTSVQQIYQNQQHIVYDAIRIKDNLAVNIKVPTQTFATSRELSSLKREFNILSIIEGEGVVCAVELLEDNHLVALITQKAVGISLKSYQKQYQVSLLTALNISLAICESLSVIHRQSICHRDLTPNNIIIDPQTLKLVILDFGSALEFPHTARAIINPHFIEGSQAYMSPEQTGRMNRGLDYRTDFYSLGVMLHELFTKQLPFDTNDTNELIHSHIALRPKSLTEIDATIPHVLSQIVHKLMHKDASLRYQSTQGLIADLKICIQQYQVTGIINEFTLASHDLHDRFIIPEKLYGRDKEIKILKDTLNHVAVSKGYLTFVAGNSGTGKTSLVKELYSLVTDKGGYIATGKFDQFLRHQPYSALTQALTSLFNQIMEESDDKILVWKEIVQQSVGGNGQVIIDVIPELELLIGQQPTVAKLSIEEQSTRFNTVMTNLIGGLGTSRYPLVLFMDDLQWIDTASLTLLEAIAPTIQHKSLLIISAYRSNEVSQSHPLQLTKSRLQAATDNIISIELNELTSMALSDLVADTVHLSATNLSQLNHLLFTKTHGNPLFFKTMFTTLYNDRHLIFDYDLRLWSYNQQTIATLPYADNVVDILQTNINQLSTESINLLQLAACIGNVFDLTILSEIANTARSQVATQLLPAVSAGLIQPLSDDLELLAVEQTNVMPTIHFRFAHDRIQQAAYHLLVPERQAEIHWSIGKRLEIESQQQASGITIFDAVEHLNQGRDFCPESALQSLAEFNLDVAISAKKSAAFNVAASCLQHASEILGQQGWLTAYDLTMQVQLQLAEACYLTSEFEQADKIYHLIAEKLQKKQHKLQLCNIQAKQYHHQGLYQQSVDFEYQALDLLGFELPTDEQGLLAVFSQEQQKIEQLLQQKSIEQLYQQPHINESDFSLTHEILFDTFVDGYLLGNGPLLSAVAAISARLSMEKGNCAVTSVAYVNYATVLCASGSYREGHNIGQLAMRLADKYQNPCMKNYTYHVFSLGINHWLKPLKSSHQHWLQASKLSMESGSPYAGWVFLQLAHVLLASGAPLDEVEKQAEESLLYLQSAKLDDIVQLLKIIVLQPLKQLRGETKQFNCLDDEHFCSQSLLSDYQENPFFYGHLTYSLLRTTLLARELQPLTIINQWLPIIEATVQAQIIQVDACLYATLHITGDYLNLGESDQKTAKQFIQSQLIRFAQWAALSPENFEHKRLLLKAELARIEGHHLQAIDLYEQAREQALSNHFLMEVALCDELTALFWLQAKNPSLQKFYIERAMLVYQSWGATAKVTGLKQQYPNYFQSNLAVSDKQATASSFIATEDFSNQLDLGSVIKASQAISQHIDVDKLTVELLNLAIENVGATRGVLLLKEQQQFICKRIIDKTDIDINADQQNIEFKQCHYLSNAVVNYVINSGQSVVFNGENNDQQFSRCEYIKRHRTKSICCVPIIQKKRLVGVLYLENSQVTYAFKSDRIQLLSILASQSAISLENARIYHELALVNKNLEHLVLERTQELQNKNRELEILSTTDQLTTLYNRRYVEEQGLAFVSRCQRYGQPMSLIMIDIDYFKSINDNYGHDVGDTVLIHIAKLLQQNTRNVDVAGRWGGEEFIILLQSDIDGALANAEKLRRKIKANKIGVAGTVTASFGVTQYTSGDSLKSVSKRADIALYQAKESGRDCIKSTSIKVMEFDR